MGRTLSLLDLARHVEVSLHAPGLTQEQVRARCEVAGAWGCAAALCSPDHVADVAEALRGSGVPIGTAVNFHDSALTGSLDAFREEAQRLVDLGATDLGLVISGESRQNWDSAWDQRIGVLQTATQSVGGLARVLVSTENLDDEGLAEICRRCVEAGAGMIQGGTWLDGDRLPLRQVRVMRECLPAGVWLKWTASVRGLSTLLLALAEGADRCNVTDVSALFREARRWSQQAPIEIPATGSTTD